MPFFLPPLPSFLRSFTALPKDFKSLAAMPTIPITDPLCPLQTHYIHYNRPTISSTDPLFPWQTQYIQYRSTNIHYRRTNIHYKPIIPITRLQTSYVQYRPTVSITDPLYPLQTHYAITDQLCQLQTNYIHLRTTLSITDTLHPLQTHSIHKNHFILYRPTIIH